MRLLAVFLLLFAVPNVLATSVPPRSLAEIVADADHVVVATIASVDMVDDRGRPVTDRKARTGPGGTSTMRLNLDVSEVLFQAGQPAPKRIRVPLWTMWHYELGPMQDLLTGKQGIFLLKGDRFEPAYPAFFQRELDERAEVEALLKGKAKAARNGDRSP
jgi:hypothetical protein